MRSSASRTTVLLLLLAVSLTACARSAVRFIPDGGSYSLQQAEDKARSIQLPRLARLATSDAEEARKDALVALRREGETGREAAEALTRVFPADKAGVPGYVEVAEVDRRPAWIVVEATPGEDDRLSRRRVWVLDRADGDVISSAVAR